MIKDSLLLAKKGLDDALELIDRTPGLSAVLALVCACETIDDYYKEVCSELDDYAGAEEGASYEGGVSVEFCIESVWWHEVSVQLRKLREMVEEKEK